MVIINSYNILLRQNSVEPAVSITLSIKREWNELITAVEGQVYSEDNKYLGSILPDISKRLQPMDYQEQVINFYFDDPQVPAFRENDRNFVTTFVMSKKIVDHVEKVRHVNRLKDVKLNLDIQIRYHKFHAALGKFQANSSPGSRAPSLALKQAGQGHDPNIRIPILPQNSGVPGQDHSMFLDTHNYYQKLELKIPMSEWVNDYLPAFSYGNYFIVEFPLGDRDIPEVWKNIEEAEKAYRQWDISGVFSSCRLAGQALDRKIKDKFGENSFTYRERWGRIYGIKNGGFDHWTSMPLHEEDIKGEGTGNRRYKEDEIKTSEADAEAMLFTIKVLAKYAEKLLKENPEKG